MPYVYNACCEANDCSPILLKDAIEHVKATIIN